MRTVLTSMAAGCAIAAAILGACGGKVVVDQGAGGAGEGGSTSNATVGSGPSSSAAGTGGCFFVPEPVGMVDPATCVGTAGMGACTTQCNDLDNHVWSVTCQDKSCRCVYDNKTICTCAIEGNATLCGGGAKSCCPPPWIEF